MPADDHKEAVVWSEPVSDVARRYIDRANETTRLLGFMAHVVLGADFARHLAERALDGKDPEYKDPTELARNRPGRTVATFREFRQCLLEMMLCREVDNFTTYLSEMIRSAMRARPGLIKTRQEVPLDYVLGFESMTSLQMDLIDRKVSDLAYKKLEDLEEWIRRHLGVPLFTDSGHRARVCEAVETRNCIVHSRGIVGPKYEKNVPDARFARGSVRELSVDELFDISRALDLTVKNLDVVVCAKFGIERHSLAGRDIPGDPNHRRSASAPAEGASTEARGHRAGLGGPAEGNSTG